MQTDYFTFAMKTSCTEDSCRWCVLLSAQAPLPSMPSTQLEEEWRFGAWHRVSEGLVRKTCQLSSHCWDLSLFQEKPLSGWGL